MGTRSLTFVMDHKFQPCVCIYRQFDGYPTRTGMGWDSYNFLANRNKVNGISYPSSWKQTSNGMEDLAAQLVMYLKMKRYSRVGNVYLYSPPRLYKDNYEGREKYKLYLCKFALDCAGEYSYFIYPVESGGIEISIHELHYEGQVNILYQGPPEGMAERFEYKDFSRMLNPMKEPELENA